MPDSPSTTRKLGLAAAIFIAAVLLSRVLGFARDAFVAAAFGANGATDAFYAAFTLPDVLNYLVAGGTLSITFIPIYTRHLTSGDEREGNRVFSIIATTMLLVLVAGVIALEVWTPELAGRYLKKLQPKDLQLAIELTRILLPAQICFYLGGLASATLMARHKFVAAAMAPLAYNAGTIAGGALLGRQLGAASLAWGTLAGALVGPFAIQMVAAWRAGLRYLPSLRVRHAEFREWLWLSLPLMIGVSLVTFDDWIIRYFAAGDVGAISCLSYARKLVLVPIAVAGQAVGQASMPFFARLHAENKQDELARLVMRSARASASIAALAAAAMIALATPLTDLLFRRGHFSVEQVAPTARYLAIYAVAIPLWGMQGILARAFYAARDTLTPMVAGTVITIASLPIYWSMFHALGVNGLVISSGIGILLHTAALLALLPRRLPSADRLGLITGIARALVLGAAGGAAAWAVARFLPIGNLHGHALQLVRAGAGGAVFLAVTLLLMRPLGVEDVQSLFDRVLGRIFRRR
ncbi:MAG TPA: murein biosynthesis integral membrane protein MurJ [Polyangia bacterium]|nr:murein biosynthesis integral membrane protein MurJ [Polyangia bacterium]